MRDKERTLAIIPARGGSKSIPHKNIKLLGGKPLIFYSIKAALDSKKITDVIVSTDDREIGEIVQKYDVDVIWRPEYLADDSALTIKVIQHVIQQRPLCTLPDKIMILQPTSPLRTSSQIDRAIDMLSKNDSSVIGVTESEYSPYKMYRLHGDKLVKFINDFPQGTPRQKLPKIYRENGAIYVSWRKVILDEDSILGNSPKAFIMDRKSSLDIDTIDDFLIAETLICKQ